MKILCICSLLVLFSACVTVTEPVDIPMTEEASDQADIPTDSIPTPTTLVFTTGDMVFTIDSPEEGASLSEPLVYLEGTTNVETVLTVNNEIYVLPAGEPYSIPVLLEEGPNVLEIVASDAQGDTVEVVLTVFYQP